MIFLCGGKLDPAASKPPSVREALLRQLPSRDAIGDARIILAEKATQALPGSNFSNLLDLEEYLSAVVDGIILIVESAGSICELGAFVKTPEICSKLIIVVSSPHNGSPSFVKLGALNYFVEQRGNDDSLISFHWDYDSDNVIIQDYVIIDLAEYLKREVGKTNLSGKMKFVSNMEDRIFFTLGVCHILRGARLPELKDCYRALGHGEFEREIIKYLSVRPEGSYLIA